MKIKQTDLITVPRSRKKRHCNFLSRWDARVILRQDKAALIRGLGEGGDSRADAGESPTAPALLLRPIRGKSRRARHKQRHIVAKLPTLGGIPRLAKAYANLWQKVCACSWRRTFDQGYRVLASRVAIMFRQRPVALVNSRTAKLNTARAIRLCALVKQPRNARHSSQGGSSELQTI